MSGADVAFPKTQIRELGFLQSLLLRLLRRSETVTRIGKSYRVFIGRHHGAVSAFPVLETTRDSKSEEESRQIHARNDAVRSSWNALIDGIIHRNIYERVARGHRAAGEVRATLTLEEDVRLPPAATRCAGICQHCFEESSRPKRPNNPCVCESHGVEAK